MSPQRGLLSLLLLTGLAGCDALGGSQDLAGSEPATFAVVGRYPSPGASGVPVSTYLEITFNGVIDESSVGSNVLSLNGTSFGSAEVNGAKFRFTPSGELLPGTRYTVALSADLRGVNGHLLGTVPVWGFKTAGAAPPPPDTLPPSGPRPR